MTSHRTNQRELIQRELSQRELSQRELSQRELIQRELIQRELIQRELIQREVSAHPLLQQQNQAVQALASGADHIDVKSITTDVSMRQFLANMFSYMPRWMRFLYRMRWLFVRLLGMKQTGIPQQHHIDPADLSFKPGDRPAFFQVVEAQEDEHWFAAASEKHLTAHLGVIREPDANHNNRFHVVTLVHYHHWTGRLYFNVIRPFHHFVVNQMIKAAAQGA